MIRIAFAAAAVSCIAFQSKKDTDGPSDKVPELKVLDHYVGEWEVEFTMKDANLAKSKSTAKWVLGGRFVEQTGDVIDMNGAVAASLKTLFTFDAKKNAYRSWVFISDGSVAEADGVWDDKAKTLTSITKRIEGEGFSTTTADFSEPGVEKWKIVVTDANGKTTSEITGKNTKLKKK